MIDVDMSKLDNRTKFKVAFCKHAADNGMTPSELMQGVNAMRKEARGFGSALGASAGIGAKHLGILSVLATLAGGAAAGVGAGYAQHSLLGRGGSLRDAMGGDPVSEEKMKQLTSKYIDATNRLKALNNRKPNAY